MVRDSLALCCCNEDGEPPCPCDALGGYYCCAVVDYWPSNYPLNLARYQVVWIDDCEWECHHVISSQFRTVHVAVTDTGSEVRIDWNVGTFAFTYTYPDYPVDAEDVDTPVTEYSDGVTNSRVRFQTAIAGDPECPCPEYPCANCDAPMPRVYLGLTSFADDDCTECESLNGIHELWQTLATSAECRYESGTFASNIFAYQNLTSTLQPCTAATQVRGVRAQVSYYDTGVVECKLFVGEFSEEGVQYTLWCTYSGTGADTRQECLDTITLDFDSVVAAFADLCDLPATITVLGSAT